MNIKINHPQCVFRCIHLKNMCMEWHNLCQKKNSVIYFKHYENRLFDSILKDLIANRIKL